MYISRYGSASLAILGAKGACVTRPKGANWLETASGEKWRASGMHYMSHDKGGNDRSLQPHTCKLWMHAWRGNDRKPVTR